MQLPYKVLNSKETKEIVAHLAERYGCSGDLPGALLLNEKKERVLLVTRDIAGLDLGKLRVDTLGCYFGTWHKGEFRLSIEGSEIVGKTATRNVVSLSHAEMQRWLSGGEFFVEELDRPPESERGYVIMRCGDDFLGCGKIVDEKILSYIPKTRHIHALYDGPDAEVPDDAAQEDE